MLQDLHPSTDMKSAKSHNENDITNFFFLMIQGLATQKGDINIIFIQNHQIIKCMTGVIKVNISFTVKLSILFRVQTFIAAKQNQMKTLTIIVPILDSFLCHYVNYDFKVRTVFVYIQNACFQLLARNIHIYKKRNFLKLHFEKLYIRTIRKYILLLNTQNLIAVCFTNR